jgi:hypothetical protein
MMVEVTASHALNLLLTIVCALLIRALNRVRNSEDKTSPQKTRAAVGKGGEAVVQDGSRGDLYSSEWLAAVAPLYALRMGTENMGPLLCVT